MSFISRIDGTQTVTRNLRIFVISLKRRTDRLEHMQSLLHRRGLTAEFIEAVDGQQLTNEQLAAYDRSKALSVYGAEMSPAELGCHMSHLKVYERIVAEGVDTALVLEDDIECDLDFADLLDTILADSRKEWLVLRLQSTKGSVINGDCPATKGDRAETFRGRTLSRVRTGILGGCGYLIRLEGARRMLAYANRPFMPIDQSMDRYWENGIEPYVLRPFPVRQSPRISSEIAGRKLKPSLGPYLTVARRVRRFADGVNKRHFQLVQLEAWRELIAVVAVQTIVRRLDAPARRRAVLSAFQSNA